MRTVRGTCLVIALALVAVSCASETERAVLDSAPSDWITYTDETASFSISYPNSWELLPIDNQAVDDLLGGLADRSNQEFNFAADLIVFGAGLVNPPVADPNVSINVEPLASEMTTDEYTAGAIDGIEAVLSTWEMDSQTKVQLAEHEAVIVRGSVSLSDFDPSITDGSRWWMVQAYVGVEDIGWAVSCGTAAIEASEAADRLETCEQVARTFELLAP